MWRLAPSVAAVAREFEFYSTQQVTEEPDGSLRVEFMASDRDGLASLSVGGIWGCRREGGNGGEPIFAASRMNDSDA